MMASSPLLQNVVGQLPPTSVLWTFPLGRSFDSSTIIILCRLKDVRSGSRSREVRKYQIITSPTSVACIDCLWYNRKHYVNAIIDKLPAENLHLNTKIVGITPHDTHVTLIEDNGTRHEYDYVILA